MIIDTYRAYYSSIEKSLSKSLFEFESLHTLRDSNIKEIKCNFENDDVFIKFRGWGRSQSNPVIYIVDPEFETVV